MSSSFSLASRAIACESGIFSSAALSTTIIAAGRKCASKKRFSVKVVRRAHAAKEDGENDASADVDAKTNAGEEAETSSTTSITTIEKTKDMGSKDEYELVGPKPERFKVAEGQLVSLLTAATPASTRLISGVLTSGWKVSLETGPVPDGEYSFGSFGGRYLKETSDTESFKRPEKPLKLYEFEGCPFCRKVREAIVWLDLDPIVYPCPQGGKRYREFVKETGGKAQFPYLIDENTGTKMYESDDIIEYLYENYGPGKDKVPSLISRSPIVTVAAGLGMLGRIGKGSKLDAKSTANEKELEPIVFYGYETSPFCKIVRERLVELEIPHQIKSTGRGSYKRKELFKKRGTFQVPYIEDPNTKKAMFESKDILEYLNREYAS
jgi:glutathione S-transferase